MSVKSVGPCALVLFLLCLGTAAAEEPLMEVGALGGAAPMPLPSDPAVPAPLPNDQATPAAMPNPAPPVMSTKPGTISNWVLGTKVDCCGPIGGNGPIRGEVFVRSGLALPVAGDIMARTLEPGWVIEGGGRALFYNVEETDAWIVDLGISNVWNHGKNNVSVTLRGVTAPVTINEDNRTFANIGLGHQHYIFGSADCQESSCRVGCDVGGRWGTEKLSVTHTKHRTDVIGGTYVALYADYEVPCGKCLYYFGGRFEWDYIWSDILQSRNNADIMDVNLMLTFGIQF